MREPSIPPCKGLGVRLLLLELLPSWPPPGAARQRPAYDVPGLCSRISAPALLFAACRASSWMGRPPPPHRPVFVRPSQQNEPTGGDDRVPLRALLAMPEVDAPHVEALLPCMSPLGAMIACHSELARDAGGRCPSVEALIVENVTS